MKVQHVPIQYVNQAWDAVSGFLKAAIEQQTGDKDYTLEQVQVYVSSGQWALLVAVEDDKIIGAATVNFFNRPNNRVAFITYIGGRLIVSKESFKQMCEVLKTYGATSVEGAVNDAVARLWQRFGFVEKYKIVEVTL
jgi:ribosomal protein S18 acetylase RimI-like enzyme